MCDVCLINYKLRPRSKVSHIKQRYCCLQISQAVANHAVQHSRCCICTRVYSGFGRSLLFICTAPIVHCWNYHTSPHPPFLTINQDEVNVFDFCHGGLAKYWSCAWRRRKFAIEFISTRGHSYNTTHTAMAPLKCIKLVSVVISLRANFHCMHSYHSSCSASMLWCTRSRHIDFHDLSLCNCSVHVKRFPWLINPSIYTFLPSLPWSVDC